MELYQTLIDSALGSGGGGGGGYEITGSVHVSSNGTPNGYRITVKMTEGAYNLKNIETGSFQYCYGLEKMVVAEGIREIGGNAFYNCYNLEELELPSTITYLGANFVGSCSALKKFTIKAKNPPNGASSMLSGVPSGCTIYVPAESVNAYKSASKWSTYADQIQAL